MRTALIFLACLISSCGRPPADNVAGTGPNDPTAVEIGANAEEAQDKALKANSTQPASVGKAVTTVGPCMMQESETLAAKPIQVTGTEPFWSARVEGRCIIYSTPENQAGVRVWTRYSEAPANSGVWLGQLDGKRFEMRVRPLPGCSDGMSDHVYPLAVELSLGDETRRGCARRL